MERLERLQFLKDAHTTGILVRCQRWSLRHLSDGNGEGGVRLTRFQTLIKKLVLYFVTQKMQLFLPNGKIGASGPNARPHVVRGSKPGLVLAMIQSLGATLCVLEVRPR